METSQAGGDSDDNSIPDDDDEESDVVSRVKSGNFGH